MSKERASLTAGGKRIIMGIMERYSTFGRTKSRILNEDGPYRTPSPPKEESVMSDNYRIVKLVITATVISIVVMCGTCAFNSNYRPSITTLDIEKAKFDAERAKSEADKSMSDHMPIPTQK